MASEASRAKTLALAYPLASRRLAAPPKQSLLAGQGVLVHEKNRGLGLGTVYLGKTYLAICDLPNFTILHTFSMVENVLPPGCVRFASYDVRFISS